MEKSIHTLIPDIYKVISTKDQWTDEQRAIFRETASKHIDAIIPETQRTPSLRLSRLGPCCPKALWHSIHTPELAEPLPPYALFKYDYGHTIEALAIAYAKVAGHRVEGEQDEIELDGVLGHRDCVIDGCIVDVKSSSSPGFRKFKEGTIKTEDSFGYLDQLDAYVTGSHSDPLVTVKDKGYLLAIDKQLGHMVLYEHRIREKRIRERISACKIIVNRSTSPACTCGTVPDGESGNIKLDTRASYNAFKYCCKPSIRTFIYADGPRYLTEVKRRPTRRDGTPIPEVDRFGNFVN